MMAVLVAQQAINAVALGGVRARKAVPSEDWELDFPWCCKEPEDAIKWVRGHRKETASRRNPSSEFGTSSDDFERIHMVDHG